MISSQDAFYFIHKSGLEARLNISTHRNSARSGGEHKEREFWKRVKPFTLREIYAAYRMDFELFGYSLREYFGGLGLADRLEGWYSDESLLN